MWAKPVALWLLLAACCGLWGCGQNHAPDNRAPDICSSEDTGFADQDEEAVVCYVGTFLTKMLSELNESPAMGETRKTAQHVRFHLLPFIGGVETLGQLRSTNPQTSSPRNSNCTVCYGSNSTVDGLEVLRNTVPAKQRGAYESLNICYMSLTDAVMDQLHTNSDGEFLVPLMDDHGVVPPFQQVVAMFKNLFQKSKGVGRYVNCVEHTVKYGEVVPWTYIDVCNETNHGFKDPHQAAVFCYVASFVSKMLWELTLVPHSQFRKTEQHVRFHLTPYLGGERVTAAVETDDVSDPSCTACYQDPVCAEHQEMWLEKPCCYDNSTTPRCDAASAPLDVFASSKSIFDSLHVCYVPLTNYIMEALPKSEDGHFLVPPRMPQDPFTATLGIMRHIFSTSGTRACGLKGLSSVYV